MKKLQKRKKLRRQPALSSGGKRGSRAEAEAAAAAMAMNPSADNVLGDGHGVTCDKADCTQQGRHGQVPL